MMKVIVTGAAGFIGYHVTRALIEAGHDVAGVDNFNTYYNVNLKHDRHALLEQLPGYVGHPMDVADLDTLSRLVSEWKPDVFCHLAAQAGVRYSLENPFIYEKTNIGGFLNVLEVCRHSDTISRLVYASSSSVYGGNTKLPFSEDDPVDSPISLYAATKKANELMAHCYSHLYEMQTIGLRFFTVYGPWGRPDMAMWLFTKAMIEGQPIKVFNHGKMYRDFTYIDDIVSGIMASLFKPDLDLSEVINLGNHRSERLLDMIHTIGEALGVEPRMEMLPLPACDVEATCADIQKATLKLGFSPRTPISIGIPQFVSWYKKYHDLD